MIETNTILPSFETHFAHIKGQGRIVSILVRAVSSYAMGGAVPSYAFLGLAGLGKTALMRALENALREAFQVRKQAENNLIWIDSPEKFRLVKSDESQIVRDACREVRPLALFVDEFHELSSGYVGPTKKAFSNFVKDALSQDGRNGRAIKWGDDEEKVHVSELIFGCNVATNYPETVKDGPAIFRRFDSQLQLDLLGEDTIAEIVQQMLEEKGVKADERTIQTIARCGRGTCEMPEKISRELEKVARVAGKATVNKGEVMEALRALENYPRGFNKLGMQILEACKGGALNQRMLAMTTGKEAKAINRELTWAMAQRHATTKRLTPYLESPSGTWFRTTQKGEEFLSACREARFKW